jgi:hypothetical protein
MVTLFLIVFRRFARPYQVLSKLIERYEFVSSRLPTDPLLSRFAHMKSVDFYSFLETRNGAEIIRARLCQVLTSWLQTYPGDFVARPTFNLLRTFLESLVSWPWVAHYAIELLPMLNTVSRCSDADRVWALPDPEDDLASAERVKGTFAPSLDSASLSSTSITLDTPPPPPSNSRLHVPLTPAMSESSSHSSTSSSAEMFRATKKQPSGRRLRSHSDADTDPSSSVHSSTGKKFSRQPAYGLSDVSQAVLEVPDEVLAKQIARLSWTIFVDIRPRDLVRYVLAPRDPKDPSAPPVRDIQSPVARSIRFVNHLSDWCVEVYRV